MISLIIPSRCEPTQIWSTVISAREALPHGSEIIVVANEPYKDPEFPPILGYMHEAETCKVIYSKADSPQQARQIGYEASKGDFLFFAVAHCVFPAGFFTDLMRYAETLQADAIFGITRFLNENGSCGCYVGWNDIMWGSNGIPPQDEPYPVVAIGHGAFGITRKAMDAVGGYWKALHGFGGEESQLNFKIWMLGMKCFCVPYVHHWHYLPIGGRRGFNLYREKNFVRNFMLIAAAYGGPEYVARMLESFRTCYWGFEDLYPELAAEVAKDPEMLAERAFIHEHAKYKTLDALRAMFTAEGIMA